MTMKLKGKVALVTAASKGLGYACAKRLAQAGCSLAICARREGILEEAKKNIARTTGSEVFALQTDLSDADMVRRFVREAYERFGRIDILIGNTVHIPYGSIFDIEDSQWYEAFDLLVMSMVRLSREVIPIMKAHGRGDIVFIASSASREPSAHLLLSNVFRVGVVALAKTLSRELAAENIRINTVNPGYFDTGRVHGRIDDLMKQKGIDREAAVRAVAGDIPMGRIGSAGELAELVAFIVGRKAEFLTGATIQIDGGKAQSLF